MRRYSLEVRCRLSLARLDVEQRRFADAIGRLRDIPPDGGRTLGPELQAQIHYWQGRALAGSGNQASAATENNLARALLQQLRSSIPERYRASFDTRRDLSLLKSLQTVQQGQSTRESG